MVFDSKNRKVLLFCELESERVVCAAINHSSSIGRIIINYVTASEVIGLELVAPEAVKKWRQCLGATDPAEAEPGTLRHLYGENKLKNVAHGCNTLEDATQVSFPTTGKDKTRNN